ncbi:MAG: hypothetical protein QM768_18555 [Agriterribacter sp.]
MRSVSIISTVTIFSLLFSSCKENVSNVDVSNNQNEIRDSALIEVVQKFNLPYPGNINLDSNSLIFYGDRTFDTSFLLHLNKTNFGINGTYYEVLPNYHRNLYDVKFPNYQILFFDGYGFKLDVSMWNLLIQKVNHLITSDSTVESKVGGRDGNKYGLIYNGVKIVKGNMNDNTGYESFYKFLKDLFIDHLVSNRQPIMYKSNSSDTQ